MTSLAGRLEEHDTCGDRHVQRLDAPGERDRDCSVTAPPPAGPAALALRTEDEHSAAGEVRRPQGSGGVLGGGPDPEVGALHLGEVAPEVDDDGDGQVLDGAGRGAADRGGGAG